MDRLTRPGIDAEQTAVRFMDGEVKIQDIGDKLLDLILNGPTINGIKKDTLRHLVRQLYAELKLYEDTGGTPQDIRNLQDKYGIILDLNEKWAELGEYDHLRELMAAEREGRLIVLPCKPGTTVYKAIPKCNPLYCECPYMGGRGGLRCANNKCDAYVAEVPFDPIFRDRIGKTLFLTHEEAEAALAKDNNVPTKKEETK